MSQKTTTRVLVTIEVTDLQPWAPDCQVETIYMRAKEAALLSIDCAIRGTQQPDRSGYIRIVGVPQVKMVMTEEDAT